MRRSPADKINNVDYTIKHSQKKEHSMKEAQSNQGSPYLNCSSAQLFSLLTDRIMSQQGTEFSLAILYLHFWYIYLFLLIYFTKSSLNLLNKICDTLRIPLKLNNNKYSSVLQYSSQLEMPNNIGKKMHFNSLGRSKTATFFLDLRFD